MAAEAEQRQREAGYLAREDACMYAVETNAEVHCKRYERAGLVCSSPADSVAQTSSKSS